ncbi:MAG: GNAT family N-acetyltransferase [Anaerolineaceae bacterium]|nr:GNAT family N-acetyltransferase [Anaerolineaceae bacterium]
MSKTTNQNKEIKIRSAILSDGQLFAKLVFQSYPRFVQNGIGLGKEERAKNIILKLFPKPKHRFSKDHTIVAEIQGKKAGIAVLIPGKKLARANNSFGFKLLPMYRVKGKLFLIQRFSPFVFIKEADKRELLISNISVLPRYQGQGVGKALVKAAEKQAKAEGCTSVTVLVGIQNTHARHFFENLGYKVSSVVLESNKRVKLFGPGYQRMVKEFKPKKGKSNK